MKRRPLTNVLIYSIFFLIVSCSSIRLKQSLMVDANCNDSLIISEYSNIGNKDDFLLSIIRESQNAINKQTATSAIVRLSRIKGCSDDVKDRLDNIVRGFSCNCGWVQKIRGNREFVTCPTINENDRISALAVLEECENPMGILMCNYSDYREQKCFASTSNDLARLIESIPKRNINKFKPFLLNHEKTCSYSDAIFALRYTDTSALPILDATILHGVCIDTALSTMMNFKDKALPYLITYLKTGDRNIQYGTINSLRLFHYSNSKALVPVLQDVFATSVTHKLQQLILIAIDSIYSNGNYDSSYTNFIEQTKKTNTSVRDSLTAEILNLAPKLIAAQLKFSQMKYDLNNNTTSDKVYEKAASASNYAEYTIAPMLNNFGNLISEYIARYGDEKLRDLAIKNGFLQLIRSQNQYQPY